VAWLTPRPSQNFLRCVTQLRNEGRGLWVPEDAPLHGIGHSNGALMHLLIGAFYDRPVASNVAISFNNKELTDAIPIPGKSRAWRWGRSSLCHADSRRP